LTSSPETGLTRRSLLRRSAIGAGVIAAAPVLERTAFGAGAGVGTTVPGEMLSYARVRPRTLKQALALAEFDDTHRLLADGSMELLLWPGDETKLKKLGVDYQVTQPYRGPDLTAGVRLSGLAPQPGERTDYRRYADYVTDMQKLATDNPKRARMFEFPETTLEGRKVFGIEIADDISKAMTDGRPTFWVDGAHHAREWPSSEYTMMFAFDLLASFGKDKRVTALLKKIRVVVVPIVNADGFVHSREASPVYNPVTNNNLAFEATGRESGWRKNKRSLTNALYAAGAVSPRLNADAVGADPNRNYPFYWGGEGGGADPSSQTYGGTEPYSEPESRNIAGGMKARQVTAYLTNHTYGKLCMRPWGYTTDESPDNALQEDLGEQMCEFHGYRNQIGLSLYPTAGTSRDWSYGALRTLVYTFEHGEAFHPPYAANIPSTYAENRPAWLLLAEAAADPRNHGVVSGRVVTASGAPAAGTVVTLTKSFKSPVAQDVIDRKDGSIPETITTTAKTDRQGRFTIHANPSTRPTTIQDKRGKEFWTVKIGRTSKKVFLDRGTRVDLGTVRL
jgi:hypothetical protein